MELNAQVGTFSPADLLAKKPLAHWTKADVDLSLGCWLLLRRWPQEQLEKLSARYQQEWGPMDNWTDEQLFWGIEVSRRVKQLADGTEDAELAAMVEGANGTAPPGPPRMVIG